MADVLLLFLLMDYKTALGGLSSLLVIISYLPYLVHVFQGKTKPHVYSWLVWAVLGGIGFGIQMQGNAGAGSWALGATALVCMAIFMLAVIRGEKHVHYVDTFSLVLASGSLAVWLTSHKPLVTAIAITLTDALGGFFPTFRKSYYAPYSETASTYLINALAFTISLFALTDFSASNLLYPASLIVLNGGLSFYLVVRRTYVRKT